MKNLNEDLLNSAYFHDACMDEVYAQHLYAALCNNLYVHSDSDEPWGCSWRYAGGLVASIRRSGDYLDWYCSGIWEGNSQYVEETTITEQIADDLLKLGWKLAS